MVESTKSIGYEHVTIRYMAESFGELIRNRREALGIKSFELAREIKRQPSIVSRIETGAYKEVPPPDVMAGLSRILQIPMPELFRSLGYEFDQEPMPTPDDPRERAIQRLRNITWTEGVERSVNVVLSIIEAEQKG